MSLTQRFYVKNIPDTVDDNAVKKFFSSVGEIFDVSVKNDYGFFSVTTSPESIDLAIKRFSGKKWNGNVITLTKAKKDNFMARLAKERENSKTKSSAIFEKSEQHNKTYYSDVSREESNEKSGIPKFRGVPKPDNATSNTVSTMDKFAEFDPMWGENEQVDSNLNVYLQPNNKIGTVPKETKQRGFQEAPLTKIQKRQKDDERRRLSLADKERERRRQLSVIKTALGSNVDGQKGKKIIFSDEDSVAEARITEKKRLFDDNNQDDFFIPEKSYLDGDRGNKLLKLQSAFNNDERFKMDERFLEDQTEDQESLMPTEMVRFDPKRQHTEKPSSTQREDNKPRQQQHVQINTQEKFYEVSENIKTALKESSTGFSLLATYGQNSKIEEEEVIDPPTTTKLPVRRNPFLCDDSSDDSSEDHQAEKIVPSNLWNAPVISSNSSDKFFFADNDPLYAEALEFINKRNSDEAKAYAENYDKTRQTLRRIFKDQSLRRAKKNDCYNKKVGGAKKKAFALKAKSKTRIFKK